MREGKIREYEKCRGGKCSTGKRETKFAGVENARLPFIKRQMCKYVVRARNISNSEAIGSSLNT